MKFYVEEIKCDDNIHSIQRCVGGYCAVKDVPFSGFLFLNEDNNWVTVADILQDNHKVKVFEDYTLAIVALQNMYKGN